MYKYFNSNSAGTSYGDTVQVTTADDAQAGFLMNFM